MASRRQPAPPAAPARPGPRAPLQALQGQPLGQPQLMDGNAAAAGHAAGHSAGRGVSRCAHPEHCLRAHLSRNPERALIPLEERELRDAVRVSCNNEACSLQFMHRECFDQWEEGLLNYLRTCGRARSWSEKQRVQNLWTKRGYDLVYKVCGCRCGRGHLRKDLDWAGASRDEEGGEKKKKKRRNKNGSNGGRHAHGAVGAIGSGKQDANNNAMAEDRGRTGSLSSGSTGSSPPSSLHPGQGPLANTGAVPRRKLIKTDFFADRDRLGGGGNGIFARRGDFSSFNYLPFYMRNSYQVKMEDEGNHGNDETRCFILSTLAAHQLNRTPCLLCGDVLPVFDRYPLVDGTFFLSPLSPSPASLPTKVENKMQYLSAVCMRCMGNKRTICRFCARPWDGSSLQMGTMYSYDIFAHVTCCKKRSACKNCGKSVLGGHNHLNYFSDYSQKVSCPHCGTDDYHFVKPPQGTFNIKP